MSFCNIKSKYFFNIIFSYLNDERKLRIINYSKSLQKLLDISIINYKLFSGKYILYETNMNGKEYDIYNNNLLFEGEYIKGKRNGKGKEYNKKGIIKFEGEYLNGKRNGKGKETLGQYTFEGEYLNGKKWNGKGYDSDGNIIYELTDGKGEITELTDKELIFKGNYENGEKNGKGKEYQYDQVMMFDGEYLNGKRWNGKVYNDIGKVICELKDGKGIIKEYENDTLLFEAKFINGELNGKIKEFDEEGKLIIEEEYKDGKKNGICTEYYDGEKSSEIEYLYDYKLKGKEYIQGRLEYEGEYYDNKKWNGKGYDENGNIIYELNNGKGQIREYSEGILIYEGGYLNGKRNGKCKEYDYNGNLIFDGEYQNGEKWNGKFKKYDSNNRLKYEIEYENGNKKYYKTIKYH